MYTYRRPYREFELTAEHIHERGQLGLNRALNIGRVIGFVGSGVAAAYGRPRWDELVEAAIGTIEDKLNKKVGDSSKTVLQTTANRKLLEEHRLLAALKDRLKSKTNVGPETYLLALEMAERLARTINADPKLGYVNVRAKIRDQLASSRAQLRNKAEDEIKGWWTRKIDNSGRKRRIRNSPAAVIDVHPIETMLSQLRIKRYMTLNYDVEIEREFDRVFRLTNEDSRSKVFPPHQSSSFEALLMPIKHDETQELDDAGQIQRDPQNADFPARVEFSDGLGKSAVSVNLSASNIGELINFAVLPGRYDAQVFHLHGRIDDLESMVLTEKDYQKRYLGEASRSVAFDEALSAVFKGNHILFVGLGMDETDMFRPLRQFTSQENGTVFGTQNVYNLKQRTMKFKYSLIDKEVGKGDFFKRHLLLPQFQNHTPADIQRVTDVEKQNDLSAYKDYVSDSEFSLKLFTQYKIFTILYGDARHRLLFFTTDFLKKVADFGLENPEKLEIGNDGHKAIKRIAKEIARRLKKQDFTVSSGSAKVSAFSALILEDCEPLGDAEKEREHLISRLKALSKELETVSNNRDSKLKNYLKTLKEFAGRYETLFRSRALNAALENLNQDQKTWWADWREQPKARSAHFQEEFLNGEAAHPCFARHRPHYASIVFDDTGSGAPDTIGTGEFQLIQTLRKEAWKAEEKRLNKGEFASRRVIRLAMPRGSGKGGLMHLLQQPVSLAGEEKERRVLDTIFEDTRSHPYHASFLAHLSFSMEFSSVLDALLDFLQEAVVGLFINQPTTGDALNWLKNPTKTNTSHSVWSALQSRQGKLRQLANPAKYPIPRQRDLSEFKAIIEDLAKANLGALRNGNVHRLELARTLFSLFTETSKEIGVEPRLFICLSGVDRLCDAQGNAHNPMYRALFRLMSGDGIKYDGESSDHWPIDFLLISGQPNVPIRYLSEQISRESLDSDRNRPTGKRPSYPDYFRVSDTDIYLRRWPTSSSSPINDRYWLKNPNYAWFEQLPSVDVPDTDHAVWRKQWALHPERQARLVELFTHELLEMKKRSGAEVGNRRTLLRLLQDGAALASWCAGGFAAQLDIIGEANIDEKQFEVSAVKQLGSYLQALGDAADRGNISAMLDVVYARHRDRMRRDWTKFLVEKKKKRDAEDGKKSPEDLEKIVKERQKRRDREGLNKKPEWTNAFGDLFEIVLRHMSLFPMPVEARVLYGCDEIHALLHEIIDPVVEDKEICGSYGATNLRGARRHACMDLLNALLEYLRTHFLTIQVRPKREAPPKYKDLVEVGGKVQAGPRVTWNTVFTRHALQNQLCDYLARKMDFSVPDNGERNFFQVSLYCDQPKDLPSPDAKHYKLFHTILKRQILQSRQTLWCLHRMEKCLSETSKQKNKLFLDDKLAFEGLGRRIAADTSSAGKVLEIDPTLESLQAVSQRTRAMYGLLRSSFSVGAITRLSGVEDPDISGYPLEYFRGWLRGITNAAASMSTLDQPLARMKEKLQSKNATFCLKGDEMKTREVRLKSAVDLALPQQPLYKDEFGWLYNERGVIALVQGNVYDAVPLFQRALSVMDHEIEPEQQDPSLHAAVRRVKLNLAMTQIERGNLELAHDMLHSLVLPGGERDHRGSTVSWIANGYLGLIKHLGGDLTAAASAYTIVLGRADERQMLRLQSIFRCFQADLMRSLRDFESARETAELALAAARNSKQLDMVWAAQLTKMKIRLHDEQGMRPTDMRLIVECCEYARSMHIPRLEAHALRVQAELLLLRGDRIASGQMASESAAIASHAGLRLMKVSGLVVYGRILKMRDQDEIARAILDEARREAERIGYLNLTSAWYAQDVHEEMHV